MKKIFISLLSFVAKELAFIIEAFNLSISKKREQLHGE